MVTLPGATPRVALATLFLSLSLAMPLHADAPRVAGRRVVASKRVAPPRSQVHLVPGQPVRFPREVIPELMRELESDVIEPGEEPAHEPRDLGRLSQLGSRPPVIGANRLINNPTGQPVGSTQSENTIAAHGRYLVAGWNESFDLGTPRSFSGFGYSSDGGQTWTDGGTLPHAGSVDFTVGDPCLTVDDDGNFYYASLFTPDARLLGVSVSRGRFTGGTFAFGPPVLAGVPDVADDGLDKEWIAADPENGYLYVCYTRFLLPGGTQIELVRSRDHGATWSAPLVLTDPALEGVQGSRVAVGPNHEVYCVYSSVDLTDFSSHMRIRKSTRFGTRFEPAVNVGEGTSDHGIYPNFVTGPPGFNRSGGVEFPSIAVDRGKGRGRGNVYVTWPEALDYLDDPLGYAGVQVEAEVNDLPAVATPISLGVAAIGAFASTTDADWYSFTGTAGQTVEFFLTPADSSAADGFLRLFCRNGDIADRLAYSYFGAGQAYVVFTLPADGTYLIRALPINTTAGIGNYYLFTGSHQPSPLDVARDSRDVMLSRSKDGIRWTRRALVNHDAPHFDNAFPEVAVDGPGNVHLVWYDHRNDAECGILTDLYTSRSGAGGDGFGVDQKVNDGPATNWNLIPSRLAPNMGDYIALTADGGTVYANWADGRLGSPDSWMSAITAGGDREDIADLQPTFSDQLAAAAGSAGLTVSNPVRLGAPIELSFALPRAGNARLEIYSVAGQRVQSLAAGSFFAGTQRLTWNARGRDGAAVSPGVYFAVLETAAGRFSRRMVLLK